ncbi:unnamed protein product [Caenorhabditis brenneri]
MTPTITNPHLPFSVDSLLKKGPQAATQPVPSPSDQNKENEVKDETHEARPQYPTPPASCEQKRPDYVNLLAEVAIIIENYKRDKMKVRQVEKILRRGPQPFVVSQEKKPKKQYNRDDHTRPYKEFVDIDDIPEDEQIRRLKMVELMATLHGQRGEDTTKYEL